MCTPPRREFQVPLGKRYLLMSGRGGYNKSQITLPPFTIFIGRPSGV